MGSCCDSIYRKQLDLGDPDKRSPGSDSKAGHFSLLFGSKSIEEIARDIKNITSQNDQRGGKRVDPTFSLEDFKEVFSLEDQTDFQTILTSPFFCPSEKHLSVTRMLLLALLLSEDSVKAKVPVFWLAIQYADDEAINIDDKDLYPAIRDLVEISVFVLGPEKPTATLKEQTVLQIYSEF